MKTAKVLRCSACKKRIRDHHPNLILEPVYNGEPVRYYHTQCGKAAAAAAMERPDVYRLTVRHVAEQAN